jgi:PAS domain S-box-containing protein
MLATLNRLINVECADLEDARRRRLLNILLIGTMGLALLTLGLTTLAVVMNAAGNPVEVELLYLSGIAAFVGGIVIFLINRFGAGWLASLLFLLLFLAAAAFGDEPYEVVAGRSLFLFVLPIIMASVLLRPYASFVLAFLATGVVAWISLNIEIVPSIATTSGFFLIALVSWLAARSLEHALHDLRTINRELDQRVAERTVDLSNALSRVQAESSKNQAILESIADGVIVFDIFGKAIVANPSVSQLLNHPVTDILGGDIQTLMSEHVSAADQETVLKLFRDGALHSPSVKFQWGKKTLSVSFAAVQDTSGKAIGHVMVCRDYTREAELERLKGAFLSMASHELRTPLNAILGYADMLQEGVYGQLVDNQKRTMTRITANARRLLGLVNNLLDQAQMEAGKLSLHIAPFAVESFIDDLKSVATVLAENKGLELLFDIDAAVPSHLTSDEQRVHQILLNLLGNAIKFTQRGSVRVRVFLTDSTHWAVEVSDTGAGIPKEAQAYIFDAFRQVDDPITRDNTGSGLGLSIVKQLANLLGGDVMVKSEVGRGSTFTVVLPLRQAEKEIA